MKPGSSCPKLAAAFSGSVRRSSSSGYYRKDIQAGEAKYEENVTLHFRVFGKGGCEDAVYEMVEPRRGVRRVSYVLELVRIVQHVLYICGSRPHAWADMF